MCKYASNVNHLNKLQIASEFKAEFAVPQLFQLIGQRQAIARQLLRTRENEALIEMYNHLNDQIKMLLGV